MVVTIGWSNLRSASEDTPRYRRVVPSRREAQPPKNLEAIFAHPTSANIAWKDIEALFVGLGAEISEREGSRVAIYLFHEVRVFHRPHPSLQTDKGAVISVKKWLEQHGVKP